MSYLVIEREWLEQQIRQAEVLREHAQSTGKPVAIAAASIRLESLKEIRDHAIEGREEGEGKVVLAFDPGDPTDSESAF
jgi:hypothetical protein